MLQILVRLSDLVQRTTAQLSLRAKGKQLLGFYQVATRIASVYEVSMPQQVAALLSVFEVFNINIGGIGLPMQCLSLGTYQQQLLTTMLAPVVVAVVVLFGFVARSVCKGGASRVSSGLLGALPWLLPLSFLVFPMVSSAAFRAFSCEAFDDGRSYLRADYAVECDTDEHSRAKSLAWLGIALYPVGISLLYVGLLLRASRAILDDQPTALSRSLGFLVRDLEPAYLWWELLEAWKKLFLVGFAVLIDPGTIVQLIIAFLFSLVFLLLVSVAMPFKDDGDDYFAKACSFALTSVFFFCVILKVDVLTEAVDDVLSAQLRHAFGYDAAVVTVGMVVSIVGSLLLALMMAAHQLVAAAREPIVKLVATKAAPELSLAKGSIWHMFLSHIWGTGQDQCATIKRQLCLLLPDVRIFLDVDDLDDIGALEEYIGASQVIMIFVSKGYFKSRNCLREAHGTVERAKPIALVYDPVKGGEKLDVLRDAECPEELRTPIFGGRDVIEWHRIKDFQLVSLRLLAEQLLLGYPQPGTASSTSVNKPRKITGLFVPGEPSRRKLAFRSPPVVFASANNPGALATAKLLRAGMANAIRTTTVLEGSGDARPRYGLIDRRLAGRRGTAGDGDGDGGGGEPKATHFLLYLNGQTFIGEQGERLAAELRQVRAADAVELVMVHETDEARDGCEFGTFFSTTPQDLIANGLYKALALALYSGPFWPASVALVAQALGAHDAGRRAKGFSTATTATRAPKAVVHPATCAAAAAAAAMLRGPSAKGVGAATSSASAAPAPSADDESFSTSVSDSFCSSAMTSFSAGAAAAAPAAAADGGAAARKRSLKRTDTDWLELREASVSDTKESGKDHPGRKSFGKTAAAVAATQTAGRLKVVSKSAAHKPAAPRTQEKGSEAEPLPGPESRRMSINARRAVRKRDADARAREEQEVRV